MTRWEHKAVGSPTWTGQTKGEDILESYSRSGWELVTVLKSEGYYIFYFKRQIDNLAVTTHRRDRGPVTIVSPAPRKVTPR